MQKSILAMLRELVQLRSKSNGRTYPFFLVTVTKRSV